MSAADEFVNIVKEMISDAINKTDKMELCKVARVADSIHYDLVLVSDEETIIKNVINMTRFDLRVGDYCYINKIGNKINNSFICYVYNPFIGNIDESTKGIFIPSPGGGGDIPPGPTPGDVPEPDPEQMNTDGTSLGFYTPFMLRENPTNAESYDDIAGDYAPGYSKNANTWSYLDFIKTGYYAAGKEGHSLFILGNPAFERGSVLSNCHGYTGGRLAEIFNSVGGFPSSIAMKNYGYNQNYVPSSRQSRINDWNNNWPLYRSLGAQLHKYGSALDTSPLMPGSVLIYVDPNSTSHTHSAVVEKILQTDSNGTPTKVQVSRSAYGGTPIGWSNSSKDNNWAYSERSTENSWDYNNYSVTELLYNPAIKSYNSNLSRSEYNQYKYFYQSTVGATPVVLSGASFDLTEFSGINIKFRLPSDITGKRFLLIGNYTEATAASSFSLEVNAEGHLRVYHGGANLILTDLTLQGDTDYHVAVRYHSASGTLILGVQDSVHYIESSDKTPIRNTVQQNLCLFADRREAGTPFSQGVKIYWLNSVTIPSNGYLYNDANSGIFVPCRRKDSAGNYSTGILNYCNQVFSQYDNITYVGKEE